MSVFLVALTRPGNKGWGILEENWPGRYHIVSNAIAFIAPTGITTSKQIKETLDISTGPDSASGVVVNMIGGGYDGVLPSDAADWIRGTQR